VPYKPLLDEAIRLSKFPPAKVILVNRGLDRNMASVAGRDLDWAELRTKYMDAQVPCVWLESNEPSYILYTSGTTGKPKGVQRDVGGHAVALAASMKHIYCGNAGETYFSTSDIGWVVGHSYIVYAPLCAGATTLFREGAIDYPDPGIAWEIVERYGVTKIFTAPTALRMFMRYGEAYPAKYDLRTLKVIACAGEPLNPEAWRWAQTHLAGDGKWGYVIDNWWQTELGGPVIGTPPSMAMRPGKAGVAVPGCEADIIDGEGKSTPPGVGGRLVLKRPFPYMLRTVWGDAARYERDWLQIPGCYVTGDVAVKDTDGYITVLGRADDVLNVAGHRIGTAEVESALVSHPAVAEAAAIGVPDPLKGETIKVFVQTRADHVPSEALASALIEHVRRELGPIATPSALEFVSSLPKTRSGKILRRFLKAKETGKDAGDISTMEG
jgi:acetyl-CoA synthetase